MTTEELKTAFEKQYGSSDGVTGYFSPGRVNLIGEHTDYNGGFVFPCALSFGLYVFLRKTDDNLVKMASLNENYYAEIPLSDLSKHHKKEWVNYPLGVIDQFTKRGIKFDTGAEMLFWGNVPNGAGLSSSAALEVVTGFAINELLGSGLSRLDIIKIGQKAENEFVGVNCGIMDQFASCMGKKDHAVFLNCDTLEFDLVPVKLDGIKIVISNTNSPHKLDAGQYNQRVAECKEAVAEINKVKPIKQLGELSQADFDAVKDAIKDPVALKRARHVVSEIKRTTDAVKALKANKLKEFGEMMNASHVSLRDDYEVTGKELDAMAEAAWEVDGVIGSRMTGGGFGGCTVSLVKEDAVDEFIATVGPAYQAKTGISPDFYVAEISDGTKQVL
jgi:galactokinase